MKFSSAAGVLTGGIPNRTQIQYATEPYTLSVDSTVHNWGGSAQNFDFDPPRGNPGVPDLTRFKLRMSILIKNG